MRWLGAIGATVLALVAFHPNLLAAKDHGSSGGSSGSGQQMSHSSGGNVSTFSHPSGQGQWKSEHHGDWDHGHGYWHYQLQTGVYAFTPNNGGWDLFRQAVVDSGPVIGAPANPPPMLQPNPTPPVSGPR
jgi:hypothetical protein